MHEVSRHLPAHERTALLQRSDNRCEVCSTDVTPDKHHIVEFAKGGPTTAENLIVLCPTCHRQLPKILTEDQQRYLQTWHNECGVSHHVTHRLHGNLSQFYLGNNLYRDTESAIEVNGQKVIYLYQENGRYYVNLVMLEGFHPRLLLLSNRLILAESHAEIIVSDKRVVVSVRNDTVLELVQTDSEVPRVLLHFWHNDHECRVEQDRTFLFGGWVTMNNCTFTRSKLSWTSAPPPPQPPAARR